MTIESAMSLGLVAFVVVVLILRSAFASRIHWKRQAGIEAADRDYWKAEAETWKQRVSTTGKSYLEARSEKEAEQQRATRLQGELDRIRAELSEVIGNLGGTQIELIHANKRVRAYQEYCVNLHSGIVDLNSKLDHRPR